MKRFHINLFFLFWFGAELVRGKYLPTQRDVFAGAMGEDETDALTLNERFFNDVRALIKRRAKENALIKELNLIDETGIPKSEILKYPKPENSRPKPVYNKYETHSHATSSQPTQSSRILTAPVLVENWPTESHDFGQVTAVAVDPDGNPVIFHRADRYWDANTFNDSNIFYLIESGPIKVKTIYVLDSKTGTIKTGWGEQMFYMPHGMTIDRHGNYWITDVAMHQAFKFKPFNTRPQLTLGKRFRPGSSTSHLCMPTSIAVATTGEFFIADGYCNQRILKYNAAGHLLRTIPQPPEFLSLQVPHGITLLEHLDLLCIADRENMRVVCPKAGLKSSHGDGQPAATIQEPDLGRVFDVAAYGNIIYAINGPTSMLTVRGFTIDPRSETIIGHWGEFRNPHSIAVDANSTSLYVTEIGINPQTNRIWKYALA